MSSSLKFRSLRKKDFERVHEIALKGWYYSYNYLLNEPTQKRLNTQKMAEILDIYYSDKSLWKSLEEVKAGRGCFLVVEKNKEIIGFIHVSVKSKNLGELRRFYLDTNFIGKGIGKMLMQTAEKFLKSKKCKKYYTFVNKRGKRAPEFYLRNGFQRVPKKDKYDEFKQYGKVLWYIEKEL